VCALTLAAIPAFIVAPAFAAGESREFFKVDVNKQKAKIDKDCGDANDFLSQNKIQNARSVIDLAEYELKQIKNSLSQGDAVAARTKIDKAISYLAAKEDSLVKRAVEILHTQGVDPALQYTQNDLRTCGVSEKKIQAAEQTILTEAPAIKQAQERDAIARTLKALESGQQPDPSTDPYIVKTAQRIIKAREDSLRSIQGAKARKEMEEKEKLERARMEKELKGKKLEEERQAKIKFEEEKKRRAQEDAERTRVAAAQKEKERLERAGQERQKQLLAQQEKAHKDSVEAQRKQQETQSKAEEERKRQQEQKLGFQEKARKDSIDAIAKRQEQLAMLKEKARKDSIDAVAKRQEQHVALEEKARKDSLDAVANRQEQMAKADEGRRRQQEQKLTLQEKARKDSIEAIAKHQEQQAKSEVERRRQLDAQSVLQEKMRKDSLDALAKKQDGLQARLESDRKRHADLVQKEKDRLARIEEERQNQQLTALQEKARKDSIDALAKRQEQQAKSDTERRRKQEQQAALQEKTRRDSINALAKRQDQQAKVEEERKRQIDEQQKEKDRLARAEEDRQKQLLSQQEKARRDSIEGQRKQQEQERQKQQLVQEEKARKEAIEKQKQLELAKAAPPPSAGNYVSHQDEQDLSRESQVKQQDAAKAAKEYLQALRDNQKKAQDQVMELYTLMEQNQAANALVKFKENRKFIAQYVDVQVYNALEQSVAQASIEAQPKPGSAAANRVSPKAEKPASREEEYIERINGFIRDNKVEAAYAELKRVEGPLRRYMKGDDFKQLKAMVENAYKIRKQGGTAP
jgi:hypothetical protein